MRMRVSARVITRTSEERGHASAAEAKARQGAGRRARASVGAVGSQSKAKGDRDIGRCSGFKLPAGAGAQIDRTADVGA
eukprot:76952-Pleurochrysis_carterae.AAC.2